MPHKTSLWCVPFIHHSQSFHFIDHLHVPFQLVELKNGETFNGHLVNCDNFMNITLREVYQTSAEGDRFWKVKECYIRGSTVGLTTFPLTLLGDTVLTVSLYVLEIDKIPARARRAARCGQGRTDARTRSG